MINIVIRYLLIVIVSLILIIAGNFYLNTLLNARNQTDILIISHRGGPAYQPENTLAAFQRAINDGVDMLEFDVQMTGDGHLVVIHDETVDRTTNGSGQVSSYTLDEIQSLDAGNGQHIPTFIEVIGLAKQSGIPIMPESKSPNLYPGIEKQMVSEIFENDYQHHTIIQSFDSRSLESFHSIEPGLSLCALYGLGDFRVTGPHAGEADSICVMAEILLLNPGIVRKARQEGTSVYVWFGLLENKLMVQAIAALNPDGIMVDDQQIEFNVLRP